MYIVYNVYSVYYRSVLRYKVQFSEKDGAFLVRKSDTVEGAYVLSLHMARVIHHYRYDIVLIHSLGW